MTEEEATSVGRSLDTLAILHRHQWSDCQREAYEQAVAILQGYGFDAEAQERPK